MRGIAQQCHAADAPLRERVAVGHGKLEDPVALAKEARHVQPVEPPVAKGRHEIGLPAHPIPVLPAPVRLALVPDRGHPVDQGAAARYGVRQEIDADAELPHGGRGLVDDGVDARLVQTERRRQTADAPARDEHAHRLGSRPRHRRSLAVFRRNSDSAATPARPPFPERCVHGQTTIDSQPWQQVQTAAKP